MWWFQWCYILFPIYTNPKFALDPTDPNFRKTPGVFICMCVCVCMYIHMHLCTYTRIQFCFGPTVTRSRSRSLYFIHPLTYTQHGRSARHLVLHITPEWGVAALVLERGSTQLIPTLGRHQACSFSCVCMYVCMYVLMIVFGLQMQTVSVCVFTFFFF